MTSVKGPNDHLVLGDYNAVCAQCGSKQKASTLKKNWQGFYVCPAHWEPRQPQDFVRGVPDSQLPAWTQPEPDPVFVASGVPDFTPFVPDGWNDPTT